MSRSKYEIKAQAELEAEGWLVDSKVGLGRWSKNRDFWNLYDLVAYKPGQIRYISIKGHNRGSTEHRESLDKMRFPDGVSNELWVWPNNKIKKGWIKKEFEEKEREEQ